MSEPIKDGTGFGFLAKVDDTQRLFTRAVAESPAHEAVVTADHYLMGSGYVNLTDGAKSAVIYLKNDESQDLFIDRIILTSEASTGGTHSHFLFSGTRNPTGMGSGTSTSANMVNSNFGSTNVLDSTSEIGQQGATSTSGAPIFAAYFAESSTHFIEQRFLLQTGNSIAFEVTPSVNNTSFDIAVGINCHLVKP